jgi:hypothetical protein
MPYIGNTPNDTIQLYAPGSDTYVMFNDGNAINAISTLTFTKGTGALQSGIFKTGADGTDLAASGSLNVGAGNDFGLYHNGTDSKLVNKTGDLYITTDGASAAGIILDSEDDTVEIKYSGTTGATFGTSGLNLASGDSYSIGGSSLLTSAGVSAIQTSVVTGLTELGSGQTDTTSDFLLVYDDSASAYKKVTPDNLGIAGGGGGTDTLQRALKVLGLVEVDAS